MTDPIVLEDRREHLLGRLRELRSDLDDLSNAYGALPVSGILLDTEGIGALTTPNYCVAGAREVFAEALIELDAATDALDRAMTYTARLRPVVLD